MFTKSYFLNSFNKFLGAVQKSKAALFIRDSLLFCHIDFLIWTVFILTVLSTSFASSGIIGALSLLFSALCFLKLLFKEGERAEFSGFDIIFIIYFLFIFVSLMGSSLFVLSFKGFLKNVVYFLFYFSAAGFFKGNKDKILPTLFIIAVIMSFESIVAVFQHFNRVEALAGWVDTSKMSDESQLISRSFGTLNPSNPNLLGGYLMAGLSSVFAWFCIEFLKMKKSEFLRCRRGVIIFGGLFFLNVVAIIFTGCRGAYIGVAAFFALLFYGLNRYIKTVYGGFSHIKKRYKNAGALLIGAVIAAIALTPSISRRVTSIFQFRGDSSISFRMNVYEAALEMFKDNPFLGIGLGNLNFREIYGLYMKTGFDALGSYCVFLEAAVESGIFALISLVALVSFAFFKGFRMVFGKTAPAARGKAEYTDGAGEKFCSKDMVCGTKIIVFSAILMIISTMAHGLFDTVWYRPQLQIIFWTNLAILNSYFLDENA